MSFVLDLENVTLLQNEDRLGKLIIHIMTVLVARGWTVEGSGDGLAQVQNRTQTAGPYNVFTSGLGYYAAAGTWSASLGGANSISNPRAWIILKEPAPSTRALLLQRTNSTTNTGECYLVAQFAYSGYATSGATANAPPAAVGNLSSPLLSTVNGAGVDFIGTAVTINSATTLIVNLLVSDVVRGGNVWPFRLMGYNSTAASRTFGMMYESLIETVSGDPDPLIIKMGTFDQVFGSPNTAPTSTQNCHGRRDDSTIVTALGYVYNTLNTFGAYPGAAPLANADGRIRPFPVYVAVATAAQGYYKGRCEYLQYNYQARNYPNTLDAITPAAVGTSPYAYAGAFMLDWELDVVPGT